MKKPPLILDINSSPDLRHLERLMRNKKKNGKLWVQAYKYVTFWGWSPMHTGKKIWYIPGRKIVELDASTDKMDDCAKGINVATWNWCARAMRSDSRIIKVHFRIKDIAVIPRSTDGKFRVFRCRVMSPNFVWPILKSLGVEKL